MRVTVHFVAQLKRLMGTGADILDVPPGCTLAALLAILADKHEARCKSLLLDDHSQPQASLLLFVNDNQVGPGHSLHEGDQVTLLTPMAGG